MGSLTPIHSRRKKQDEPPTRIYTQTRTGFYCSGVRGGGDNNSCNLKLLKIN